MPERAPYRGPAGTGFVSLKRYLELNPESARQMGGALTQDVTTRGQQVQQGMEAARTGYGSAVAAATPVYDASVGTSEEAAARAAGAAYTGPESLAGYMGEGYGALQRQAGDVDTRAGMLGSDAGRAVLLQQQFGRNSGYTPGSAGLDAFLAGRGGGEAMQSAGQKWGGMRRALGLAEEEGLAAAAGGRSAAEAVRKQYEERAGVLAGQEREAESAARERLRAKPARPDDYISPDTAYSPDSGYTTGKKGGVVRGEVPGDYNEEGPYRPKKRSP